MYLLRCGIRIWFFSADQRCYRPGSCGNLDLSSFTDCSQPFAVQGGSSRPGCPTNPGDARGRLSSILTDADCIGFASETLTANVDIIAAALDASTGGNADEDIVVAGLDEVPGGSAYRGIVAAVV